VSTATSTEVILVSNGPGELYTWVRPVLAELRRRAPEVKASIALIPCQFASGGEARIAGTFGADAVTTPRDFLRFLAGGAPLGLGASTGAVVSLGGSAGMALKLARRLRYGAFRYAFVPYWHPRLDVLFVPDERAAQRAMLLGTPKGRLDVIGNLVADAVDLAEPVQNPGRPHVLLFGGSRGGFAVHMVPFMLALADALHTHYPQARFVWPVSRLLSEEAIQQGVAGTHKATLGGMSGRLEGSVALTPSGARVELVPEETRYAHMRAADLAVTIPGTNTLELGIAGVPSVVLLPLNKPEVIPLEGPGHWLSLLPVIGTPLKRRAVKLAAPHLPVSLPNNLSGEPLMVEVKGEVTLQGVLAQVRELLDDPDERTRRKTRLFETMPRPGAAARLVERVLSTL